MVQEACGWSSQDNANYTDHNLETAGVNSMAEGDRRSFVQDTNTVGGTPIPDAEGFPVRKSEVQGTANSRAAALPTHHPTSHPSSGHTRSTNQVQPAQDTSNSNAVALPTHHSTPHPSSGHIHNTNRVQPVQDTSSAGAGTEGSS